MELCREGNVFLHSASMGCKQARKDASGAAIPQRRCCWGVRTVALQADGGGGVKASVSKTLVCGSCPPAATASRLPRLQTAQPKVTADCCWETAPSQAMSVNRLSRVSGLVDHLWPPRIHHDRGSVTGHCVAASMRSGVATGSLKRMERKIGEGGREGGRGKWR